MTGLETRPLGRTSLEVTVLGLGTGTLGGHRVRVAREQADEIVRAAWASGLRYFDTAPFYGSGRACRIVGDVMREVPRHKWVLSTKVGRLLRPSPDADAPGSPWRPMPFEDFFDYSYAGVMRSFEASLQRLGLASIDILYVHDIGVRQHGAEAHPAMMRTFRESGYRALDELRSAGTVRAIGIGVNESEALLEAMEWGDWDAFLLAGRYTLLEQEALDDLLPRCVKSGISVVIGAPFNTGILAGRDTWNYKPAPPSVLGRVHSIEAICKSHGVPLIAAALQFPLAHSAIAAVLPGPRSAVELETDVELLQYPIPRSLWSDLKTAELLHPDAPTPA
jgi:D-threo-aldose 1-dehydrogenase